jgi:predicted RNase H-like nuclease (RuvC/YqgF family)
MQAAQTLEILGEAFMKKAQHMILATALVALAFNGAFAENKKNTKAKKDTAVAAQPAADVNYEQKIVEMQKSIEQLHAEIENIKTARNELQVKLEQSDKDIAAQTLKVEEIKKKLTEKKQAVEALAKEKKP